MHALLAHIAHGRAAIARGDFRCAVRAFGRALAIANRVAWGARGRILAALSFARRQLASAADRAAGAVAALVPGGRAALVPVTPAAVALVPAVALVTVPAAVASVPASQDGAAMASVGTAPAPGIVRAAASILATCRAMAVRFIRAAFGPHGAVPLPGTIRAHLGADHDHDQVERSPPDPVRLSRVRAQAHACGPPGPDR